MSAINSVNQQWLMSAVDIYKFMPQSPPRRARQHPCCTSAWLSSSMAQPERLSRNGLVGALGTDPMRARDAAEGARSGPRRPHSEGRSQLPWRPDHPQQVRPSQTELSDSMPQTKWSKIRRSSFGVVLSKNKNKITVLVRMLMSSEATKLTWNLTTSTFKGNGLSVMECLRSAHVFSQFPGMSVQDQDSVEMPSFFMTCPDPTQGVVLSVLQFQCLSAHIQPEKARARVVQRKEQ